MTASKRQEFSPPENDLGVLAGAMSGFKVLPGGGAQKNSEEGLPTPERTRKLKAPRHTYNVSDEVHQQAVNAVDFLSGPPQREQLGRIVERAILKEVKRAEAEHNGGEPFPQAARPLRAGKRAGG